MTFEISTSLSGGLFASMLLAQCYVWVGFFLAAMIKATKK